jgi:hypothetical protein
MAVTVNNDSTAYILLPLFNLAAMYSLILRSIFQLLLKITRRNHLCFKTLAPRESKIIGTNSLTSNHLSISTHPIGMDFLRLTPEDSEKGSATNPMDEKTNTSNTSNTGNAGNARNATIAIPSITIAGDIDRAKLSKLLHRYKQDDLEGDRWQRAKAFYTAMLAADRRRERVTHPTPCPKSEDVRAKMQELRKEMIQAVAAYVAEMEKLREEDDELLVMNGSPRVENPLPLVTE